MREDRIDPYHRFLAASLYKKPSAHIHLLKYSLFIFWVLYSSLNPTLKSYLNIPQDKLSKSGVCAQGNAEDTLHYPLLCICVLLLTYIAVSYILCLPKPHASQDPMREDSV